MTVEQYTHILLCIDAGLVMLIAAAVGVILWADMKRQRRIGL